MIVQGIQQISTPPGIMGYIDVKKNPYNILILQMVNMNRIFDKFSRQTGAGNKLTDLQKRIIEVLSRYKHAKADIVGSSSGKGIQESGEHFFNTFLPTTRECNHFTDLCLSTVGIMNNSELLILVSAVTTHPTGMVSCVLE